MPWKSSIRWTLQPYILIEKVYAYDLRDSQRISQLPFAHSLVRSRMDWFVSISILRVYSAWRERKRFVMLALAKTIIRISIDLLIIRDICLEFSLSRFFLSNPCLISRQLYNENFHEVSVMLIGEVSLRSEKKNYEEIVRRQSKREAPTYKN